MRTPTCIPTNTTNALALADCDRAIKINASCAGVFNAWCMTRAILGHYKSPLALMRSEWIDRSIADAGWGDDDAEGAPRLT